MTRYNLNAKYILVAKEVRGETTKFIVSDFKGKTKKKTQYEFTRLLGKGKVANCKIEGDQFRGDGMTLRHLPTYNKDTGVNYREGKEQEIICSVLEYKRLNTFEITGRVMKGKECTGYEISNIHGKTAVMDRVHIIQMIKLGYITNATYQLYKDKHYIKGKGFSLNDIKQIKN